MNNLTVWDPLRKKDVKLTEEEKVRQWFISVLSETYQVPPHMMMSEVSLSYGIEKKEYRADIVIYGRNAQAVAIVECKRPDVRLNREVLEQALRYSMVLEAKYFILTNGHQTLAAVKDNGRIKMIKEIPEYTELCQQ